MYIDDQFYKESKETQQVLTDLQKGSYRAIDASNMKVYIKNFSRLYFPCEECTVPHVFFLVLPLKSEGNHDGPGSRLISSIFTPTKALIAQHKSKVPDKVLSAKWSFDDKEQLKKFMLIYGYGRWKQIQENSKLMGGKLHEKSISEVRAFANAFIRTIIENLSYDKSDLKNFLYNLIEEQPEDPYIASNSKDWDVNLIRQRAVPWGKRIQLLYRVRMLIKKFKEEYKRANPTIDMKKQKSLVPWDNMLNFLPNSVFYGQRPSVWWTKRHDCDLLRGTYKYGYANYTQMKNAPEFSFSELERANNYQEFPNADTITRRLKKLIQIIVKSETHNGSINFDDKESDDECEGWTPEEKRSFFLFLLHFGVPLNSEGKSNWGELREKYLATAQVKESEKNIGHVEKMVQRIRMQCQHIIQEGNVKKDSKDMVDEEKIAGTDDFEISYDEALKFNKTTNMLDFIRRTIISNNRQIFKSALDDLVKKNEEIEEGNLAYVSGSYNVEVHDLGLLVCIAENGLNSLKGLSNNSIYGFEGVEISQDQAMNRLEFLCDFYRNYIDRTTNKKRKSDKPLKDDLIKKKPKFILNRDDDGNIVYPVHINNSLTIMNFGRINTNPNYHSEHNLFPVGFKSVRVYASMFTRGVKAEYSCEIIDGGEKPIYKVTSNEDQENPIIKDSSTGCWVHVLQRVNDLQEVKKAKVTISGTERFGLLEPNVVRVLEYLPNAEKCSKYKFKHREFQEIFIL